MTPSHVPPSAKRQSRYVPSYPATHSPWAIWRLGGRYLKKLVLVAGCIALFLLLASLDPSGEDEEPYIPWNWESIEMVSWLGNMTVRMADRRSHLKAACQATGLDTPGNDSLHKPNVWELLINRQHHLIWCNVFKAASTSWMYNFNILAGYRPSFLQTSKQVPLQLARRRYPRPSLEDVRIARNDSISFLIVRHPLERLLSGYRDKIENALAHTYHQKLNNYIIQHYRKPKSQEAVGKKLSKRGNGRKACPTFSEFVDYLIDLSNTAKPMDMHWTPINGFCTPCQINYDVIMKFETLEEDQNYLIHLQKLERWIRPQWKNPSKGGPKTSKLIKQYYSQLTQQQILQLNEIYRYDMLLFNYTLDGYLDPGSPEQR